MREIKFRAWDKSEKIFLNNKLNAYAVHAEYIVHVRYKPSGSGFEPDFVKLLTWPQADNLAITQYTGLNDNRGREIYEGDMVHVKDGWGDEWKSEVRWGGRDSDDVYPAFDLRPEINEELNSLSYVMQSGDHTIVIIGNIYENPELLGGSNE